MVFQNNLLMGAGGQPTGYDIDQSCRFNDGDSAYLYRDGDTATPSSDQDCTISAWVKRGSNLGSNSVICSAGDPAGSTGEKIRFGTGNQLQFNQASSAYDLKTTALYRDPAAWYHVVGVLDLNNGTQGDRVKLYVNGERITDFATETYPSNTTTTTNFTAGSADVEHTVGSNSHSGPASQFFDGYIAEIACLDGQVLAASSFGETNSATGQWIPKSISGLTFGTNGYYLDFADSSALGNDVSGNDNDFTSSGLAAADQVTDSPTDNFCTWNPVNRQPAAGNTLVLSEGNLELVNGTYETHSILSTHRLYGKQYMEIELISSINPAGTSHNIGIVEEGTIIPAASFAYYSDTFSGMLFPFLVSYSDGVADPAEPDYGTLANGDTLGFAISEDDGKFWCRIDDGDWLGGGDPETTSSTPTGTFSNITIGQWIDTVHGPTDKNTSDFGQLGYAYTAPSGYETVSSANLDDPTIADPSAYVQATTYTGDGASSLAVNQGGNSTFSPALVWIKNRDATDKHVWFDTVRGVTESISCDNTDVEETNADTLTAFDSDGFTVGADVLVNTNTEKYVGWQWLADESWSSGATGTRIASSGVRNTTMGFSVASWTHQTSANYNIAHGLSSRPGFFTTKCLTQETNWGSWHQDQADVANRLILNTTSAETTAYWSDPTDNTDITSGEYPVTSTLFGFQHDTFNDTHPLIAYFFTEVEGFSKFGSYTGNGNADGPFIWTGFKPSIIIVKRTDAVNDWTIKDSTRNPYNVVDHTLLPAYTNTEYTATWVYIDILSNGFKVRSTDNSQNTDSGAYVFAAFAETPFKTALAR